MTACNGVLADQLVTFSAFRQAFVGSMSTDLHMPAGKKSV